MIDISSFIKKLAVRRVLVLLLCVCTVLTALIGTFAIGTLSALRVNYNGKLIGIIRNKGEFQNAVKIVERTVCGANVSDTVAQPTYTRIMTTPQQLDNEQTVARAIIENTEEIAVAYAVTVDGETVACVADAGIYDLCDQIRCRFETGDNAVSCFTKSVSITSGYYVQNEIGALDDVRAVLEAIPVKTEYTETRRIDLPYETQKTKTNSLLSGCTETVRKGENGLADVTETVILVNGVEASRKEITKTVLKNPQKEILLVGSGIHKTHSSTKVSTGFTFPLPKSGWVVTAWYGDGRNHRAIDIACDAGTPIYSVLPGKVIFAGWDGEYGYAIVIDHGNGLQTRYAHVRSYSVSRGKWVNAGEQIAEVGRTGYATGNHLHFEVLVHGKRMNPAPYIGL